MSQKKMLPADEIKERLTAVREKIAVACEKYQRDPASVHLLAVSKTKPQASVEAAMAVGQVDFGENYLQDALEKIEVIDPRPVWHFIGAIQSNKTRQIAEHFDWVHTVSSGKVARRLNDQRPDHKPPLKVFLQVNIDQDPNKSGFAVSEVAEAVTTVLEYPNLELQGLMTLPSERDTLSEQRQPFRELRKLQERCCPTFTDLSMGMSGDLEAAIAEGATWVRVGTDIFGARGSS